MRGVAVASGDQPVAVCHPAGGHRVAAAGPAGAARSPLRLSLAERKEISRGLAAGEPLRAIARRLERAPSTVSREVTANGGRSRYRACTADRRATAASSPRT